MMTNDLRDILREELAPIRAEIDALEHALLRIGEQRLAAIGPAVSVHHDEVGGRHTGDVCRVATNDRVRDLLIQAEDFGFDPVTID